MAQPCLRRWGRSSARRSLPARELGDDDTTKCSGGIDRCNEVRLCGEEVQRMIGAYRKISAWPRVPRSLQ